MKTITATITSINTHERKIHARVRRSGYNEQIYNVIALLELNPKVGDRIIVRREVNNPYLVFVSME